jgi:TatD DNase family protein
MSLIDSHCHLDSKDFDADRNAVIERARAAGVDLMVAIGTGDGPPDLKAGIRLAEQHDFMYATVGVCPQDAGKASAQTWLDMVPLTTHPRVVAVGEIGLDYYYDNDPRDVQRAVFARQMEIAREAGLPIFIHTRDAWADTFALLREHWAGTDCPGGIFHCFSGSPAEAEEALALGFLLSYSGIITFPKAEELREAVRRTPLDRLLVETDSPYLAPVPWRGKRNEPAFVVETARKVAEVKGLSLDEVADATTSNWKRLCLRTTMKAR